MMHFQFPVYEYVQLIKAPVTIFHGTSDEIIPCRNSLRLKSLLKAGDEYITIERAGHNNMDDFQFFHQKLDSVLRL